MHIPSSDRIFGPKVVVGVWAPTSQEAQADQKAMGNESKGAGQDGFVGSGRGEQTVCALGVKHDFWMVSVLSRSREYL